jgi:hypothetical protein
MTAPAIVKKPDPKALFTCIENHTSETGTYTVGDRLRGDHPDVKHVHRRHPRGPSGTLRQAHRERNRDDMTTRITQADLNGTSERGKAAYNERRRWCRAQGLRVPRDLFNDDDGERDPHGGDNDSLLIAKLDAEDAELKDIERTDRIATAEQRKHDPWLDRWLRRQEEHRRH